MLPVFVLYWAIIHSTETALVLVVERRVQSVTKVRVPIAANDLDTVMMGNQVPRGEADPRQLIRSEGATWVFIHSPSTSNSGTSLRDLGGRLVRANISTSIPGNGVTHGSLRVPPISSGASPHIGSDFWLMACKPKAHMSRSKGLSVPPSRFSVSPRSRIESTEGCAFSVGTHACPF